MTGLFYKDFKICKAEIRTLVFLQALITFLSITFSVTSRNDLTEEVMATLVAFKTFLYLLDLFLISIVNTGVMSKDEKKNWHIFINSTPDGKKAQIRSKYTYILFLYIVAVAWLFILEMITAAICNTLKISIAASLFVLLGIIIIYDALQIPFIIGFGASHGEKIKSTFFTLVCFLIALYALFGDISMFIDGDFERKLFAFLNSAKSKYIKVMLPFVAAVIYWLSYRVSLLLYKKEGERYEE